MSEEAPATDAPPGETTNVVETTVREDTSRDDDYRVIFTLLDRDSIGSISAEEMAATLHSSGRTEGEAADIVAMEAATAPDVEREAGEVFTFDRFRKLLDESLMRTTVKLAHRQGAPPPSPGAAVPRHYAVVAFLSILADYKKRLEANGDYAAAASVKEVFDAIQVGRGHGASCVDALC